MAIQYGADTAITITAGSLASAAARASAAVTTDTSKNVVSVLVEVKVGTTTTAPSGNKQVVVYGYRSSDGTDYSGASSTADNVDGTDKAITMGVPTNLVLLGVISLNIGAVAATVVGVFDLAAAFGSVPPKWGIVLVNDAGTALGGTVSASYREIHYT